VNDARIALRKFVKTQMQPGDLVAIVPTALGSGAFQMFASDKQRVLSIIDKIQWFIDVQNTARQLPASMACSYFINALRDMRGRKSLIIISQSQLHGDNFLADTALRAGVVVHTLNVARFDAAAVAEEFAAEAKEGMQSISIEAACATFDGDNAIQDSSTRHFEYLVPQKDVPWIKKNGLKFSLVLPVKKPGAYYVRAAVKDQRSGKIGSAYQFIEIPDVKNGRLSLSNLFIINRDENLPWVASTAQDESQKQLSPDLKLDPRKSPALRSFLPGESIEFAAIIYNADKNKTLVSQLVLYREGKELYRSELEPVDLNRVSDLNRIPIRKNLLLDNSANPGDYIMQLQAIYRNSEKRSIPAATQAFNFKVLEK
jgi:hypothetical protein